MNALDTDMPSSLSSLTEDTLIDIFALLAIPDVLRIRCTCKTLNLLTRDKLLWIRLLREVATDRNAPLPLHRKSIDSLDASQIEALTLRALHLAQDWARGIVQPRSILRLDLPRCITWVRVVSARWLLVASSDAYVSSLICWDINAVSKGSNEPTAECFFPGPIKTGEIEMQTDGLVIALAVESRTPSTEIISLCQQQDDTFFVTLGCLLGVSYVRLLHGDFVGCALLEEESVPHFINWRTGARYSLTGPPTPHRSSLVMTIWGEYIVVVRPYDVQLFSRPSSSSPPRLLRAFEFGHFAWEAVIVDSSALKKSLEGLFPRNFSKNTDSVISFILTHQHDAFLYVIETDFSLNGQSPHDNLTMRLAKTYGLTHGWMNPSWHLRAGITGKRITWISGGIQLNVDSPILCSSVLNLEGPGICNFDDPGSLFAAEIEISDTEKFPALWAFPQFDFDEALGLLAVGNVFGELAVCDYVSRWSDDLLLLAEDISAADAPSFLRLPDTPVPMDILPIVHESPDDGFPDPATLGNVYASWNAVAETGARIPPTWSNDWSDLGPEHMLRWQGTHGDRAWFLEHAFHFLGRPEPILYRDPGEGNLILFRAGGLHFILGDDGEEDIHVYSDRLTLPDILGHESMMWPDTVRDINWTADRERGQFELLLRGEVRTKGRNRWIEQKERGGSPPVSYLTVPQIKTSFFELRPLTPDSDIEDVPAEYC